MLTPIPLPPARSPVPPACGPRAYTALLHLLHLLHLLQVRHVLEAKRLLKQSIIHVTKDDVAFDGDDFDEEAMRQATPLAFLHLLPWRHP